MNVTFESLTDRQKRGVEARQFFNEDAEFRHQPLSWIGRDRRGSALVKSRFSQSMGLFGRESGWMIDNFPTVDWSQINAAGAVTFRSGITSFPSFNPAHVLGSVDPMPYEQGVLTAASGDRQIGSSAQAIALLLGVYIVHITSGGAVYNPATTTLNVRVVNTVTTVAGAFTTQATINVATAANMVDSVPIASTTGRQVSLTGTNLTNIAALFNGDSLFAELVLGGATNIQGNILYAVAEIL